MRVSMLAQPKPTPDRFDIDEYWVAEWIAFGFVEIGVLLAKHMAFERFYETLKEHERKAS